MKRENRFAQKHQAERFNITIKEDYILYLLLVNEYNTVKFCPNELYKSNDTITDWKMYLREVCADNLLKNSRMIGEPEISVKIDELSFSKTKL